MLVFDAVAILLIVPIFLGVGYVLGHAAGHREHTKFLDGDEDKVR